MKNILAVSFCLLTMLQPLRAESVHVELKYLGTSEFLEMLVRGTKDARFGEDLAAVVKNGEGVVSGVRVRIDQALNTVEFEGEEKGVAMFVRAVRELDVRPTPVRVEAVMLTVEIGGDVKSAMDEVGWKTDTGSLFFEGKNADLDALVEKACASKRVTVVSRPVLSCVANKEATMETGAVSGGAHTFKVTPLVNSKGEITLQMESSVEKGDATQQLNTTVRLPVGATVVLGGTIIEEPKGTKRELLLLVRPTVLEGEEP